MHLDFIAEGIQHDLDEFEKWASTLVTPILYKDKEKKEQKGFAQVALRPRRAYTLVFPRESLDVILNTLDLSKDINLHDGKGTKILKKPLAIIRKFLRLKPIPEADKTKGSLPIVKKNIRLIGLGLRDDIDIKERNGNTHEGL